jgi:hypothetical protein
MRTLAAVLLLLLTMSRPGVGAPKPVPASPYLPVIYRYADGMLKNGRDVHGPQKTGLLLSAIDRQTLSPLNDRPIANPQHDQNLLRVLYTLSELSSKPIYREAADAELKWLLEKPVTSDAPLPPWERGFAWNVVTDKPIATEGAPARAWMLWDRCFGLSPDASKGLAVALIKSPASTARQAGFSIRAFAAAYQHTRDDTFLKAIESKLTELELNAEGLPASRLSCAIDCGGAATRVSEPLATRLHNIAAREDQAFSSLAHDLKAGRGFALGAGAFTELWQATGDRPTTAGMAMMCVSRYENTGNIAYRDLIHAAADAYRDALPADDLDLDPMPLGHAISLQLAAWRSTSRQEYLDGAIKFADLGLERFWADGPLPRASSKSTHYATSAGADTLALSLIELHLSILHITAVRCPPNTIDR